MYHIPYIFRKHASLYMAYNHLADLFTLLCIFC